MSNTNKYFADLIKVCSVLPVFAVMPAMAGTGLDGINIFEYNDNSDMYTMNSNGAVGSFSGYDASDRYEASVVFVGAGQELSVSDGAVIRNNKAQVGGAIAITGKTQGATLNIGRGVEFLDNIALFDGGAIGNYGNTIVAEGVSFKRNKAQLAPEDNENQIGGGAISLGSTSKTTIVNTDFISNESGYNGGAIGTRLAVRTDGKNNDNSAATLKIFGSDFIENKANGYKDAEGAQIAGNGGAIYNTFYADVVVDDTEFERNYAAANGGAIYNDGTADDKGNGGVMTISDSDFEYNTAVDEGGAVFNKGTMTIADSKFTGNSVIDGFGGAIKNNGTITVRGTDFYNNVAYSNGAFSTSRSTGDTTITGSEFINNSALADGGALGLYLDASVTGVLFKNNIAAKDINLDGKLYEAAANANGGGALFVGQKATATLTEVRFLNNESGVSGGAITARHNTSIDNGFLTIEKSEFSGNLAGKNGGAIESMYDGIVNIADTTFKSNTAKLSGGVIYNGIELNYGNDTNIGTDSTNHGVFNLSGNNTFANNVAGVKGGAIFNDAGGIFTLDGTNTFTENTANGMANDIHNLGALTIASGITSFDGGITGDGVLNINKGATLNMNYASIEQASINIDGTLVASLLNANDALDITGGLSGEGRIDLNIGSTGVYDLSAFSDFIDMDSFGKTYNVSIEDGVATLTAKQAAEIAKETGITGGAAGAVSAFATASDAKLQAVSLAVQEALNNGDVALVEKEMAKVNPDSKPVGQSVASSVQGQVVSVAAGRMSVVGGGATGRSGGDVSSAGFWAQGLVNKSKMGGAFKGHTTGFALGGDTLIDDVFTLGAGFAFNGTEIDADGRDTSVESNSVFAYAQYKPSKWYANATFSYTMSDYTDDARVFDGAVINKQYDTKAFGAQAMFGYDFASGVTPEVGLRYLYVSQEEHVDGLNRVIKEMNSDVLTGIAGLNYAFAIESDTAVKFSPSLRAAMTYDVMTPDAVATIVVPGAAPYYVDVDSLSRLGGEFGIGLTAEYRGLELSLNYELDLHDNYTSQTGLFKFRYDF